MRLSLSKLPTSGLFVLGILVILLAADGCEDKEADAEGRDHVHREIKDIYEAGERRGSVPYRGHIIAAHVPEPDQKLIDTIRQRDVQDDPDQDTEYHDHERINERSWGAQSRPLRVFLLQRPHDAPRKAAEQHENGNRLPEDERERSAVAALL